MNVLLCILILCIAGGVLDSRALASEEATLPVLESVLQEVTPKTDSVEEPAPQDPPPTDPLAEKRSRLLADAADPAQRVQIVNELLHAGDWSWLEDQIRHRAPDHPVPLAVLCGLISFAESAESPDARERGAVLLNGLLLDGASRTKIVTMLCALCSSDHGNDPLVITAAIESLGAARDLQAMDTLIGFLESGEPQIRTKAARALYEITYRGFGGDAAAWKAWWDQNRSFGRDRILEDGILHEQRATIDQLNNENLLLVKSMVACDPKKAFEFLSGASKVKRFAAAFLLENVTNLEVLNRLQMVVQHLKGGEPDKPTLNNLLALLGHATEAYNGLGAILVQHLQNTDPAIVATVAGSLDALDKKKLLKIEEYHIVAQATQSRLAGLVKPGSGPPNMVNALIDLLDECGVAGAKIDSLLLKEFADSGREKKVRKSAIKALGVTGDPNILDYLAGILRADPDLEIRFSAANSLKLLGEKGNLDEGRVIAALSEGLKDLQSNVRSMCVGGLGVFKNQAVIQIILEHLKAESEPKVCTDCIDILGEFASEQGLNAAIEAYAILKGRRGVSQDLLTDSATATKKAVRKVCEKKFQWFFGAAESFFKSKCFAMAAWSYDEFLTKARSGNGDDNRIALAKGKKARAHFATGNLKIALALLEEIEGQNGPEPTKRERLRLLSEGYLRDGDHGRAATWFDQYLAVIPEAETDKRLAALDGAWQAHFAAGHFDRSVELSKALTERQAGNNLYLFRRALSLARGGKTEEGQKALQELLNGRLQPAEIDLEWETRSELAQIHLTRQDFPSAQSTIGKVDTPLPEGLAEPLRTRVTDLRQKVQAAVQKDSGSSPPDVKGQDSTGQKAQSSSATPAGSEPSSQPPTAGPTEIPPLGLLSGPVAEPSSSSGPAHSQVDREE